MCSQHSIWTIGERLVSIRHSKFIADTIHRNDFHPLTLILFGRCFIPECETLGATSYETDWLPNAVPFSNGKPMKCSRYEYLRDTQFAPLQYCPKEKFNQSSVELCSHNQFVFKNDEKSIQNEVRCSCLVRYGLCSPTVAHLSKLIPPMKR